MKIIECTIIGLPDESFDDTWDENEQEFVQVKKTHEFPMFSIRFEAEVDIPIKPGCVYLSPEGHTFIGLSDNRICNREMWMSKFNIPTDLILIYSPHIESWNETT